jgi:hypothetical protein
MWDNFSKYNFCLCGDPLFAEFSRVKARPEISGLALPDGIENVPFV